MLVRFLAKNLDEINQGNIERRISETAAQSQNDDYSLVCNCKGGLNFILDKCHHPFHFKIYVLYKFDLIKTPGSFENFNKFQRPTPAITPPPPHPHPRHPTFQQLCTGELWKLRSQVEGMQKT